MKTPQEYGYVVANNICLFQKGPLSQWWGGYSSQNGGFSVGSNHLTAFRDTDCGRKLDAIFSPFIFTCCEQWMMANKATLFDDWDTFLKIMGTPFPQEQKNLGREIKNFKPEVWDHQKRHIVTKGNVLKFAQNPDLKVFLKQFHPFTIFAEAAPWDKIWGIGLGPENPDALEIDKWKGENLLGRALMEVRKSL